MEDPVLAYAPVLVKVYSDAVTKLFSRPSRLAGMRARFLRMFEVDMDMAARYLIWELSDMFSLPRPRAYLVRDRRFRLWGLVIARLGWYSRREIGVSVSAASDPYGLMETVAHEFFHYLVESKAGSGYRRARRHWLARSVEDALAERFARLVSGRCGP
ncbi:MAG: hypothetical protein DRO39_08230 [Thermoprotei archaeon]|nr:MAG: hypothetical protein DRO39_08230 [Thermoprotei archaeon]